MGRCDTGLQACYRECCDPDEVFRAEEAALPTAGSFHLVIQQSEKHPEPRDSTSRLSWVPRAAAECALLLCSVFQLGEDTLESLDWLCTCLGHPKCSSGKQSFSFPATGESLNQESECR